jgi:hypothetical protein
LNEAVKELQFARELENAVMKGLARDAADRQASVLAFADDVRRGAASESAAPLKRGIFSLLGSLMGRKS